MSDQSKDQNAPQTDTQNEQQAQQDQATPKTIDVDQDGQPSENIPFARAEQGEQEEEFTMPEMPDGFPEVDEGMLQQMQEMMAKLGRAEELEAENAELKGKLGRLAADFDGYRNRMSGEMKEAEGKGISKAAQTLMPVYDDLFRAVSMGAAEPEKLIPGMQAVQLKLLTLFAQLGLEATGRKGEDFDPQWHEAIQVTTGDEDDKIVQVYELGFRMGDKLVRPARVVVSKKG